MNAVIINPVRSFNSVITINAVINHHTTPKLQCLLSIIFLQKTSTWNSESIYMVPGCDEDTLYCQLDEIQINRIPRREIRLVILMFVKYYSPYV